MELISEMRLVNAMELFLGGKKATTARTYRRDLDRMAKYIGETRPVADITPAMLLEYFQKEIQAEEKNYSPATVHKHAKTMKVFFNWCVKIELVERSPAGVLHAPTPPRRITRDKAMTDYELERILDYTKHQPRNYALILWLSDTAARAQGTSTLKVDDVDFAKREAVITEKGKTAPVFFGRVAERALRVWLDYRLDRFTVSGPFIWSNQGQPISARAVSQVVRRACKGAGVRSLGSHSLRHRKGHQFADAKVAPSIAATALRHSDPAITMQVYYPSDWETARKELEAFSVKRPPKVVPFNDEDTG